MAAERSQSLTGSEAEEEKRRRQSTVEPASPTGMPIKEIKAFLSSDDFLSAEAQLRAAITLIPSEGKGPNANNLAVIIYKAVRIKIDVVPLLDKEGNEVGQSVALSTQSELPAALELMIKTLADMFRGLNEPKPWKIILTPKNKEAEAIMKKACKDLDLTVVPSVEPKKNKTPAPGASLKLGVETGKDGSNDTPKPRLT
jgi:hypothetical protein